MRIAFSWRKCRCPYAGPAPAVITMSLVLHFGFSFFWLMFWTHQEHKKTADLHQAAESSVEIFSFGRSLSRTSTLADQGTLPSPTTGCRIRFTESLLMLCKN